MVDDANVDDKKAVREQNDEIKRQRKQLIDDFLKPGNPGLKLKTDFDRIIRNLTLPKAVADSYRLLQTGDKSQDVGFYPLIRSMKAWLLWLTFWAKASIS